MCCASRVLEASMPLNSRQSMKRKQRETNFTYTLESIMICLVFLVNHILRSSGLLEQDGADSSIPE